MRKFILVFIEIVFRTFCLLFEVYAFLKFLSHHKQYAVFCTLESPMWKDNVHQKKDNLALKINEHFSLSYRLTILYRKKYVEIIYLKKWQFVLCIPLHLL